MCRYLSVSVFQVTGKFEDGGLGVADGLLRGWRDHDSFVETKHNADPKPSSLVVSLIETT